MAEEGKVEFELASPERLLISRHVDMVVAPGAAGDFGVLPRHAPLISTLRPGVVSVHEGGAVAERIFVAGGFAEVTPERCTVLAQQAVPVADIDAATARQRVDDVREDVADAKTDAERDAAARLLVIAEAMLRAVS